MYQTPPQEWERPRQVQGADGSTHVLSEQYRMGNTWTLEEHEALLDAVLDGATAAETASALARSSGAVTSRLRRMVPAEATEGTRPLVEAVREFLSLNPDHDWQAHLADNGAVVLPHRTLNSIEALDRDDPGATTRAVELTGLDYRRAESLLRKHGSSSPASTPAEHYALRVRNLRDGDDHLPTRAHAGDAGLDLRHAGDTPVTITSREHTTVPTGVAIAVPEGFAGLVVPRSGLARKHGLSIVNSPGIIDHGYTGEVQVMLITLGADAEVTIQPGERIAQLVLTPVITPPVMLVADLGESDRGDGGFGSTGTA